MKTFIFLLLTSISIFASDVRTIRIENPDTDAHVVAYITDDEGYFKTKDFFHSKIPNLQQNRWTAIIGKLIATSVPNGAVVSNITIEPNGSEWDYREESYFDDEGNKQTRKVKEPGTERLVYTINLTVSKNDGSKLIRTTSEDLPENLKLMIIGLVDYIKSSI